MLGEFYRNIVTKSSYAYAYIKIITDEKQTAIDCEFIEVNEAFVRLLSLPGETFVGKRITDLAPHVLQSESNLITILGRIGLTGRSQDFIHKIENQDRWVSIRAMSPEIDFVAIQAVDVSKEIKRLDLYENLISFTPTLLAIMSFDGTFILANNEWTRIFGYQKVSLLGSNITDYIDPQEKSLLKKVHVALYNEEVVQNFIHRFRHLDGSYRFIEWQAYVSNNLVYGAAKDVTERIKKEKQKQRELDLMNLLFDQTLTGMCMLMLDSPVDWEHASDKEATLNYVMQHQRVVRTNQAFLTMYQTTAKQITGVTVAELYKHNLKAAKKLWRKLLDKGRVKVESEVGRLDGSLLWVMGDYSTLYDHKGLVAGHFGMQLDISDRKASEIALAQSEHLYRLITEHASDVIWVYNITKKKFNYISPSAFNFLGYRPDELISIPFSGVIHPDDIENVQRKLGLMIKEFCETPKVNGNWKIQMRHIRSDEAVVWADSSINFRYGEAGNIEIIGVSRDITERKLYEEKILHLSYRDQLTGLYNRRYLEEQHATRFATEQVLPLSLVVCDVNGLKLTNDVFGHQAGDLLLKACANYLRMAEESDTVIARTGGDEFVMVFPNTTNEETQKKIAAIQKEIATCNIGRTKLSVSFGFATLHTPSKSFEPLFKEAEDVMYRRKLLESSSYKHDVIKLLVAQLHEIGPYEKNHSEHVAKLAYAIGEALGLPVGELDELRLAALLHDIGKIAIESDVLNRKGPLSSHEWARMRRHPEMGFQILRSVQNFGRIADWILVHHERPDGRGYPQGLKDSSIPLPAKIIAVANAFDAMTNNLGYRTPIDPEEARKELLLYAGTQFDPTVVEAFLKLPLDQIASDNNLKEIRLYEPPRNG